MNELDVGNIKRELILRKVGDKTFEIFGKQLGIVEDRSGKCVGCALQDFCYPVDYPYPCRNSKGELGRKFIEISDFKNGGEFTETELKNKEPVELEKLVKEWKQRN